MKKPFGLKSTKGWGNYVCIYYMGTVIAALVSVLVPSILISFGVVNRDKHDVKLRNAATELGMDFEVWKIDKRRRKRIEARVNRNKITVLTRMLVGLSICLSMIANVIIWTPGIRAVISGDVDAQSLVIPLVIASVVIALLGLAIAWINLTYVRKKLASLKSDSEVPFNK